MSPTRRQLLAGIFGGTIASALPAPMPIGASTPCPTMIGHGSFIFKNGPEVNVRLASTADGRLGWAAAGGDLNNIDGWLIGDPNERITATELMIRLSGIHDDLTAIYRRRVAERDIQAELAEFEAAQWAR